METKFGGRTKKELKNYITNFIEDYTSVTTIAKISGHHAMGHII